MLGAAKGVTGEVLGNTRQEEVEGWFRGKPARARQRLGLSRGWNGEKGLRVLYATTVQQDGERGMGTPPCLCVSGN
jgi:hypothetical protein